MVITQPLLICAWHDKTLAWMQTASCALADCQEMCVGFLDLVWPATIMARSRLFWKMHPHLKLCLVIDLRKSMPNLVQVVEYKICFNRTSAVCRCLANVFSFHECFNVMISRLEESMSFNIMDQALKLVTMYGIHIIKIPHCDLWQVYEILRSDLHIGTYMSSNVPLTCYMLCCKATSDEQSENLWHG